MPTHTSKGSHGTPDSGSKKRGDQKAAYGSAVSPEVGEAQAEAKGGGAEPEARTDDDRSARGR